MYIDICLDSKHTKNFFYVCVHRASVVVRLACGMVDCF